MTRDDDPGRAGPVASQPDGDELDPLLVRAFGAAFDRDLPVDVEARHLWQLYRSARPPVIDGLSVAPDPGRLQRMLARVAITVVVALVPSALGVASADALPGDVLYAVKRHHQLAQVELAVSWTERDAALVQLAELRLDEARAVVGSRPRAAARVVADADAALDELASSPLPSGSLQARRMRDAAAREVAALLDDVPDLDRTDLQVAFRELSDSGLDSPLVASAQLAPGADDQRSSTLRRRPREPGAPDAARSAAPGMPAPTADDRQLLARAPDDEPGAALPEPTTPTPSRPASAAADAVATAPSPAGQAPSAVAPTAPPSQQPVAVETEDEDPPPATDEAPPEPGTAPAADPQPSTVPSEDDDADRPTWALPGSGSAATTVSPEPTAAPSPQPTDEPTAEPTAEPTPASSAEPTARPSARSSQQPEKRAVPATKSATKGSKSVPPGLERLAPSDAPAATEVP